MKVLSLIGARPQFIKEAILYEEFQKSGINEIIVNSGQHYEFNMADVIFQALKIKKPEYDLCIGSGKHGEMTGRIMIGFEKVVEKERPDWILVYGDTNTTLAGAVVGAKMKIKIAHIEAGIRMIPRDMPEEINRVLADRISTMLFCPSLTAVYNLKKEGIENGVHFVGDVMYDLYRKFKRSFRYETYMQLKLKENNFILMTLHRDYNVDFEEKLTRILEQVRKVNQSYPVVFPIHPRTKKRVSDFGLGSYLEGINVIEPADYLNLMGLLTKSFMVITDSGGLQKEAYFAGKNAAVIMPDTGWPELIEYGCNFLCDENNLYDNISKVHKFQNKPDIYGLGNAGERIVRLLSDN